jgi:integrase
MPKLTKTIVDNLKPDAADYIEWDTELEGFGVRVMPTGRKVYMVRYRVKDAKRTQRKQNVARCSDMPPDRARDLARKIFAQVAEGIDPMLARSEEKGAPTLVELEKRYTKEHAKPFKKPRSVELDDKNWRMHILPVLGSKRVKDVTRANILSLHGGLSGKPGTANQVLALLSKAFNLAEDWEWRDRNTNPCHKVKKYQLQERELILSPDQIGAANQALTDLVASYSITQPMADLVRLLMFTGCRLREIMHAKCAWIDRERSLLLLPDSKVGQRKIPLSPASLAIIDGMPQDQEWLIPGRVKGEPMITPYKSWSLIKKTAGLPKELRIHDLRHTAGSLGHMAGLSQKQIATMLGHAQLSTTERYLHGATGDAAVVAEKMGNVIMGAFGKQAA